MRIVLFTVENPDYVPSLLDATLEKHGPNIVAAFVSRGPVQKWMKRTKFLLRNRYPFCIRPGDWLRYAQLRLAHRPHSPDSMLEYLRGRGVRTEPIAEIRSEETRRQLAALAPDVFLFCPFDQIAGPKFLSIPKMGTFNVHLGKLPEYRGGLSAFWVLRRGDPEAGATVHEVIAELDAGAIVSEVRIPVRTPSMHELMLDTARAAGPMVADALDRIRGGYVPIDKTGRLEAYYTLPTYEDFRVFYRRGCRLI
jgi:hypothetical protein